MSKCDVDNMALVQGKLDKNKSIQTIQTKDAILEVAGRTLRKISDLINRKKAHATQEQIAQLTLIKNIVNTTIGKMFSNPEMSLQVSATEIVKNALLVESIKENIEMAHGFRAYKKD